MGEDNGGGKVRLRNCTGIPVIELAGDLNDAALRALEKALRGLASAGHYNIVVNLKKAAHINLKLLCSLGKTISQIRSHYGAVDLVAEAGQIRDMLRLDALKGMFRLNASEAQAICRIKRLLRIGDDPNAGSSARLTE